MKRQGTRPKIDYINNSGANVDAYHAEIMRAIANGGTFSADYADVFRLTEPAGVWVLEFA